MMVSKDGKSHSTNMHLKEHLTMENKCTPEQSVAETALPHTFSCASGSKDHHQLSEGENYKFPHFHTATLYIL